MNANKHLSTNFAKGLVIGLQHKDVGTSGVFRGRPVLTRIDLYYGTVPAAEVDRRRTKGKAARVARKVNRRTRKGQH